MGKERRQVLEEILPPAVLALIHLRYRRCSVYVSVIYIGLCISSSGCSLSSRNGIFLNRNRGIYE